MANINDNKNLQTNKDKWDERTKEYEIPFYKKYS